MTLWDVATQLHTSTSKPWKEWIPLHASLIQAGLTGGTPTDGPHAALLRLQLEDPTLWFELRETDYATDALWLEASVLALLEGKPGVASLLEHVSADDPSLCVLLVPLYRQHPEVVLDNIQALVQRTCERAVLIEDPADSIRPLLPALDCLVGRRDALWPWLWTLPNKTSAYYTVLTTLLVAWLPSWKDSTPLDDPLLWKLWYDCLSAGLDRVPKKLSWVEESWMPNTAPAVDWGLATLWRRRALYLMRLCVPEWSKYVACFETLEMEVQVHLMEQVWETVAGLDVAWKWRQLLWARALIGTEAVQRKWALYRLLNGQAGILLGPAVAAVGPAKATKGKGKKKGKPKGPQGIPLADVSVDFVLQIIIPSFDSLETSVGKNLNIEVDGKVIVEDLVVLLTDFVGHYVAALDDDRLQELARGLWSTQVLCRLYRKTSVQTFAAIASGLEGRTIGVDNDMLQQLVESLTMIFSLGSIVHSLKASLLRNVSTMLAQSTAHESLAPLNILKTLTLFPLPKSTENDWIASSPTLVNLRTWLGHLGDQGRTMAATVATAFVDGMLVSKDADGTWDPSVAATNDEINTGRAIALLAALVDESASALLWPAIGKGLSSATAAVLSKDATKAAQATRALLLLENGCKLRLVSGMGNGDLVMDASNQMMPPPPHVESLLVDAVSFTIQHLEMVLAMEAPEATTGGGSRSAAPKLLATLVAALIERLSTIQEGYPSSMTVSGAVDAVLKRSVEGLENSSSLSSMVLLYASASCGGTTDRASLVGLCKTLLHVQYRAAPNVRDIQAERSLFQYAKWGALSCLLPKLLEKTAVVDVADYLQDLFEETTDAVEATPANALFSLFRCIVIAARATFVDSKQSGVDALRHLSNVAQTLCRIIEEAAKSQEALQMIDETCSLLFSPVLLEEESKRFRDELDTAMPIRDAFRKLISLAGRQRSHISRTVLCRVVGGWWKSTEPGMSAIPYKTDLVDLLLHKELRIDESATSQTSRSLESEVMIPPATDELSVGRAFCLVFFAELPGLDSGLQPSVQKDLIAPVVLELVSRVSPKDKKMFMKGTAPYCLKMRGWQALCVLSRFVDDEIAAEILPALFESLSDSLHGQIRYFIEVFVTQCSRRHPALFGKTLVDEIGRNDLSLQHIASLMVIAGNLLVGNYQAEFLPIFTSGDDAGHAVHKVVAGSIPWLSSSQGFSRAIAQILVHKLLPLAKKLPSGISSSNDNESGWYLDSLFQFLDGNNEMKRLRKKQMKFFDTYDADSVCTPNGILNIPVDEGNESNPIHLIDAVKESMKQVFDEMHDDEVPTWRQLELVVDGHLEQDEPPEVSDGVNFQRKIVPLDALNLALEHERDQRLRNRAGRLKQPLIVCASLVDKVPNLGGLARTSEIFAADRLVIPDLRVCKTDNFQSTSVGAGDWIEIEECRREDLLPWLRRHKQEGYFIVGVEQTSSSRSLKDFPFPTDRPILVLLGMEKEGIPVEYLHIVDQCIEIPQLGIIRSLNVHVSGAIVIWEYTRQRLLAEPDA